MSRQLDLGPDSKWRTAEAMASFVGGDVDSLTELPLPDERLSFRESCPVEKVGVEGPESSLESLALD